jgi:hypothetical protein
LKTYKLLKEVGIFSTIWMALAIGILIFLIFSAMGAEKVPSRDEICQKHFGKDYVWQNGYRSADFCVDSSGIPKYPKSWRN